jgi:hypothetical protein
MAKIPPLRQIPIGPIHIWAEGDLHDPYRDGPTDARRCGTLYLTLDLNLIGVRKPDLAYLRRIRADAKTIQNGRCVIPLRDVAPVIHELMARLSGEAPEPPARQGPPRALPLRAVPHKEYTSLLKAAVPVVEAARHGKPRTALAKLRTVAAAFLKPKQLERFIARLDEDRSQLRKARDLAEAILADRYGVEPGTIRNDIKAFRRARPQ